MVLNNAMIMTPWRPTQTTYVLQESVAGSSTPLTFPATGSLTIGRNYWPSGDGQADADGGVGGVGDLLAILKATLDSHANPATFTVTLDANFRVNISTASTVHTEDWDNAATTLPKALFGFAATTLNAILNVGTLLPQYIWRPKRPIAEDSRERQPVVGGVARALSGLQRVSALSTPKKERDLLFRLVTKSQILQEYEDATEPYGSFEENWVNNIALGRPFRYYPDETSRTSSSYQLYVTRSLEDPLTRNDQYRVYWDVALQARAV